MSGMELNKVMAAVLVAGIVACFSGFIAREAVHPHQLHEDAVPIEAAEGAASGGPTKAAGPDPVLDLIASADITRGEKVSKACAACHSFDKGGADGTGPNLWNVMARGRAAEAGFSYSDDMKAMGGKWTYDDLNHFLWKPKSFVAGTKMNFIGLKKAEDRAALIAWLRTMSDSAPALPSAADIAAEQAALGVAEEVESAAEEAAETAHH